MHSDTLSDSSTSSKKPQTLTLFFMTTLYLGSQYVYDLPQALQTQLQAPPLQLSFLQYDSLYSVYSFPNIFLPLAGGYILKLIGLRRGTIIYALLVLFGQLLFTIGVMSHSYFWMICGRMLYAIGSENLSVAQSVIATKWFSVRQLAYVLGWNQSIASLGGNLNIVLSPIFYEWTKALWFPCFIGTVVCLFSVFSAVGYNLLDRKLEQDSTEYEEPVKCRDLKRVPKIYFGLSLLYVIFYLTFDGVTSNINDQIHKRFGFSNSAAGQLTVIYYIQLILLPPLLGKMADKSGKRIHWVILSTVLSGFALFLLGCLPEVKENGFIVIIPLILLGFCDAIFETVMWSCLLLAVEPGLAGVAYGFATSGMNLFNVIGMSILGHIQDSTNEKSFGYYYSQMFLTGVSAVSFVIACIVLLMDLKGDQKLSLPGQEKVEDEVLLPKSSMQL